MKCKRCKELDAILDHILRNAAIPVVNVTITSKEQLSAMRKIDHRLRLGDTVRIPESARFRSSGIPKKLGA
jgi:hypothetical protein